MERATVKTILLGVSGSISAYKAAGITSQLTKLGYNMEILVTKSNTAFITPLALQSLSKNPVHTDAMTGINPNEINHTGLAKKADLLLVAPASANTIGKLVHGITDDLLSAVALALYLETLKVIAPAMGTYIYQNPIAQRNTGVLKEVDYQEIIPRGALLACGDHGRGAPATVEDILQTVMKISAPNNKE